MQKIPAKRQRRGHACRPPLIRLRAQFTGRAIECIAHDWVSQRGHMHPNLVRASGLDPEFDQSKLAVRRIDLSQHRVVRHGLAATEAPRRHARATLRMAAAPPLYWAGTRL